MYPPDTESDIKETGRVEAFSDGVIAIAITLLVLEIRVPHLEEGQRLADVLWDIWPAYLAYIISFFTIGIMWINHHRLFRLIKRVDDVFLGLNTLLMMMITFVNFPTSLLADHLDNPDERRTAALIYSGTFVVTAIAFNGLWRYASYHNRLIDRKTDLAQVNAITQQYNYGPLMYLAAFLAAFISVPLSLAINFGLAIFFALPGRSKKEPQSGNKKGDSI
ncbi:MAG: DUF1211 domain-containing protein [Chloroflexi bacterium]|nr:DUF1211 domain-containing protein [Chloroflexota bacterium]